jgi:hypothetical protein
MEGVRSLINKCMMRGVGRVFIDLSIDPVPKTDFRNIKNICRCLKSWRQGYDASVMSAEVYKTCV